MYSEMDPSQTFTSFYPSLGINGSFDGEEDQQQQQQHRPRHQVLYNQMYPITPVEQWSYNMPQPFFHGSEYFGQEIASEPIAYGSFSGAPDTETDAVTQRMGTTQLTESQLVTGNMFAIDEAPETAFIPEDVTPAIAPVLQSPSYVHLAELFGGSNYSPYPVVSSVYPDLDMSSPESSAHGEPFSPIDSGNTSDSTAPDTLDSQLPLALSLPATTSPRISEKNRVTKPATKKKQTKQQKRAKAQPEAIPSRVVPKFICTFGFAGCNETFGAKNEWKRHVSTQHFKFLIYQCDIDNCSINSKATFVRKDLFNQHLRRMHFKHHDSKDEALARELESCAERCKKQNRAPPQSATCSLCGMHFSKDKAWDKRMEHVGEHYESQLDPKEYEVEPSLLNWMIEHQIIEPVLSPASGNEYAEYTLTPNAKHMRHPARRKSDPDFAKAGGAVKKNGRGAVSAAAARRPQRSAAARNVRTRKMSPDSDSDSDSSLDSDLDADGECEQISFS